MRRLFRLLCCVFLSALVQVAQSQATPGDTCTMHDGAQGKCTVQDQCLSITEGVKNKTFKRRDIKVCGFRLASPVICCPEAVTAAEMSPTKKYVQKCEEYSNRKYSWFEQHIISGFGTTRTELGEFPHMAAIGFQNSQDPDKIYYVCGGALISERFILTAAHCFVKREFKATTVKLGRASLVEDEDEWNDNPHIDISIKNITRHPDYKRSAKYNDIALIELEKDVNFTYYARPACLHHPGKEINSQLHFTGWGRISAYNDLLSNWLLKGAVNESDFNTCKAKYDSLGQFSLPDGLQSSSQLCATGRREDKIVDTCQGDGGGPLQYRVLNKKTRIYVGYIYGLVSFGAGCGSEDFEGVYTRVSHYLDWIENIVWP